MGKVTSSFFALNNVNKRKLREQHERFILLIRQAMKRGIQEGIWLQRSQNKSQLATNDLVREEWQEPSRHSTGNVPLIFLICGVRTAGVLQHGRLTTFSLSRMVVD